jgi:glycerophosphoryl diester phosphodiesterase
MSIARFLGKDTGPFVSAHRGYSTKAPENTLPALECAFKAGADIAEIDIRMTVDGNLVLLHDADVDRTTDGHGSLSSMTLAEVKKLDAGTWFDPEFKGTVIPTLDEVLDWSRNRLALLIELKNYPQRDVAFINQLAATILRNDAAHFSIPSSFDHPTLSELHRRFPEWTLAMILPCRLSDPVHAAHAAGATLISMEPEFVVSTDIAPLHDANISVLTTLASPEHGEELFETGLDVFESDDVAFVCETIRRLRSRR